MYLLDSDHLSLLQRQRGDAFDRLSFRLRRIEESQVFIPIIAFHERIQGWNAFVAKSSNESDVIFGYRQFRDILADFADVQLADYQEAESVVFQGLLKQRIRIGTMDLRIASIAIARDFTLLTSNTVDFEKVPALRFEDWTVLHQE
jgi:tRNA(fMet)-specific endonuclease VapC